jgi:hypothetical protein
VERLRTRIVIFFAQALVWYDEVTRDGRRAADSQRPMLPPIGEITRKLLSGFNVKRQEFTAHGSLPLFASSGIQQRK